MKISHLPLSVKAKFIDYIYQNVSFMNADIAENNELEFDQFRIQYQLDESVILSEQIDFRPFSESQMKHIEILLYNFAGFKLTNQNSPLIATRKNGSFFLFELWKGRFSFYKDFSNKTTRLDQISDLYEIKSESCVELLSEYFNVSVKELIEKKKFETIKELIEQFPAPFSINAQLFLIDRKVILNRKLCPLLFKKGCIQSIKYCWFKRYFYRKEIC